MAMLNSQRVYHWYYLKIISVDLLSMIQWLYQLIYGNYIICFGFNIDHYMKLSAQLWDPISWWGQWGFPVGSVPSQIQPAWAAWKAAWARNLADWEGWIYMAIWILFEALLIYDLVGSRNCLEDRLHASGYMQVPISFFKRYHTYEQTLLPSVQTPTLTPESSYMIIHFSHVHYCWDIAEIISTIVVLFQMVRRVENTHSETREVPFSAILVS